MHFWWPNKRFIWGRSSWKTLYETESLFSLVWVSMKVGLLWYEMSNAASVYHNFCKLLVLHFARLNQEPIIHCKLTETWDLLKAENMSGGTVKAAPTLFKSQTLSKNALFSNAQFSLPRQLSRGHEWTIMNECSWEILAAANRKVRPSQKIILKSMHSDKLLFFKLILKMKMPLSLSK